MFEGGALSRTADIADKLAGIKRQNQQIGPLVGTPGTPTPSSPGSTSTPTGCMMAWPGTRANIPFGWTLCDGTAISRSTYATLFGVIGTSYGAGDGSTTFNIPTLQNLFLRGVPAGHDAGVAEFGGVDYHVHDTHSNHVFTQPADHSASTGTAGAHTHDGHTSDTQNVIDPADAPATYLTGPATHSSDGDHSHSVSVNSHSGGAVDAHSAHSIANNVPSYGGVLWIIKL